MARRRPRAARQALARANAIAARIGARPLAHEIRMLATRARIELRDEESTASPRAAQSAAPARTGPQAPPTGLTPRQLQVLKLVAAGLTNREIGQLLFITEKTAGAHVSGILSALSVRSRVEAATIAQRLGLLPAQDPRLIPR